MSDEATLNALKRLTTEVAQDRDEWRAMALKLHAAADAVARGGFENKEANAALAGMVVSEPQKIREGERQRVVLEHGVFAMAGRLAVEQSRRVTGPDHERVVAALGEHLNAALGRWCAWFMQSLATTQPLGDGPGGSQNLKLV